MKYSGEEENVEQPPPPQDSPSWFLEALAPLEMPLSISSHLW